MQWLLSGGDGYTDDVGTYSLDSAQNVATLTWLKDDLVGEGADRTGRAREAQSCGRLRGVRARRGRDAQRGTPR